LPVLCLDGEMEGAEFMRRAYRLARGLGYDRPPEGLHYYRLAGPLGDPGMQEDVRAVAKDTGAGFIVLDSLTMAAYSTDSNDAPAVIATIKFLETLGTVLAIDHIPKAQAGVNQSHYSQFGSSFKRYAVRSQMQLVKADGGAVSLLHKKSNFGPLVEPINMAVEFDSDAIRFSNISGADERLAGLEANLPAGERVYQTLVEYEGAGAMVGALAEDLKMAEKTVRNHLTALKRAGRVENVEGNRWRASVPDQQAYE
jgi:DNA-binding transcriptional ArsR family regulator